MNKQNVVSVIVPIYKVEKYLDECVRSLVNQTYKNLEIILVDDGSPDSCPTICDNWEERDNRIRVVHKENGGLSDARNAGIKIATGEWLLFVDSDDVISTNLVNELVVASTDSDYLAVSGNVRFIDELPTDNVTGIKPQKCGKDLGTKRGGMYCWGGLYSRELVQQINLWFDTSLRNLEDVVWNGIYLRYISEVVYVDVPYYYRMNPTSITSKCVEIKWQVASWIAARRSIMNWFENKQLSAEQKKEVSGVFRHCQNNIYSECVAGDISYSVLRDMQKEGTTKFCQQFVPALERYVMNHWPTLYYGLYALAIRIKNTCIGENAL